MVCDVGMMRINTMKQLFRDPKKWSIGFASSTVRTMEVVYPS